MYTHLEELPFIYLNNQLHFKEIQYKNHLRLLKQEPLVFCAHLQSRVVTNSNKTFVIFETDVSRIKLNHRIILRHIRIWSTIVSFEFFRL